MKTPKTPIEFDYDLWTTEDGKCMVRVKSTGEVTEVDREVMKALRAEEKRIRRALRSNEGTVKDGIQFFTNRAACNGTWTFITTIFTCTRIPPYKEYHRFDGINV